MKRIGAVLGHFVHLLPVLLALLLRLRVVVRDVVVFPVVHLRLLLRR